MHLQLRLDLKIETIDLHTLRAARLPSDSDRELRARFLMRRYRTSERVAQPGPIGEHQFELELCLAFRPAQ